MERRATASERKCSTGLLSLQLLLAAGRARCPAAQAGGRPLPRLPPADPPPLVASSSRARVNRSHLPVFSVEESPNRANRLLCYSIAQDSRGSKGLGHSGDEGRVRGGWQLARGRRRTSVAYPSSARTPGEEGSGSGTADQSGGGWGG
ncbi:unnamed protein product [Miscanthus lutarioriparius]|uniref:Uncharacterized protein n=1 Tax=Miscanthus lutarioriparius TaxID=422564 RepID=A0A811MY79_9POAL|nr:unnamed protein product [Miscanthus lutarioriparius]